MFGIFVSALFRVIGFILGGSVLRYVGLTVLAAILTLIWQAGLELVGGFSIGDATSGLGSLPEDIMWFLLVFRIDLGVPMVLAAYIVRFAIRRLPVIG